MFIKVTSTQRSGQRVGHVIAVEDIASLASNNRDGAIISLKSSEYQIWTDQPFAVVEKLLQTAGAFITESKEEK